MSRPTRPKKLDSRGRFGRVLPALALGLAWLHPAQAAKGEFKVGPGPVTISPEEQALGPDAAKGMEHAVILLEETDRDESLGTHTMVSYHLRAKIFTREGRDIANVTIPFNIKKGELRQWWGRVLLADGGSAILKQGDLKPQTVVKTSGQEYRALKGALPGVEPGCVIDYGYVYWEEGVEDWTRVALQRGVPVLHLGYRWLPYAGWNRTFYATRTESLDVKIDKVGKAYVLEAKEIPTVPEEPWMPSEDAVRAMVNFYYLGEGADTKDFWNSEAKRVDKEASSFTSSRKTLEDLIGGMNIPPGADLRTKLKSAYDWIAANIRNTVLMTSEEEEKTADPKKAEEEREKRSLAEVIAAKEAEPSQLEDLYLGVARALGAEANIVLATDRTEHYWDPGLLTLRQFDWRMVAVRAPGEPDDKAILVDTGSGLPFGEIPWVVTGPKGYLTTSNGYREIPLWPSEIQKNVSETKAEVSFTEDLAKARWTRTGTGQQGYFTRRELRHLTPEEREEKLDALCGAGRDLEATKAEAPKALVDPSAEWLLECEADLTAAVPDEGTSSYTLRIGGPWNEAVPDFPSATRVHPIVFSYPRIDRTILDVSAPPGFAPATPPAPVHVEERFGRYTLSVKATPSGYRAEREFMFGPLLVRVEDYAALRSFLQDVTVADRTPLEFRRTTSAPQGGTAGR